MLMYSGGYFYFISKYPGYLLLSKKKKTFHCPFPILLLPANIKNPLTSFSEIRAGVNFFFFYAVKEFNCLFILPLYMYVSTLEN